MDIHQLQQDSSQAALSARGAELQALRLGGLDLLWHGGSLWPRHAPLLFPVVGALRGDSLRHQGRSFALPKHGFARDRDFVWIRRDKARCALELRDDAATRERYPFPFRLQVAYTLEANRLRMDAALHNPAEAPLPASFGLHPAFRWPLAPGLAKETHRLVFEAEEPGPLRRLEAGTLLDPRPLPSPIRGRELPLRENLFAGDALIFLEPRSRGLRFEAEGGPSLILQWEGFPHLGLWAKPSPDPAFLCIEPWEGYASPSDWDGECAHKPGGFVLPPGDTRRWSLTVSVEP